MIPNAYKAFDGGALISTRARLCSLPGQLIYVFDHPVPRDEADYVYRVLRSALVRSMRDAELGKGLDNFGLFLMGVMLGITLTLVAGIFLLGFNVLTWGVA